VCGRYQYYQNASHVIMTILQKNLKPEDTQIDIEPRQVRISGQPPSQGGVDGELTVLWLRFAVLCCFADLQLKVVVKKDGADVVVFDKPLYDEVVVEECGPKFFATKARGWDATGA
jgi:hypothetical protein